MSRRPWDDPGRPCASDRRPSATRSGPRMSLQEREISGHVGLGHGVAPEDGNRLVVNAEGALGVADVHLSGRADR